MIPEKFVDKIKWFPEYGSVLRKIRVDAGLSLRDLSKKTKLSCNYISKIELSKSGDKLIKSVSIDNLKLLCRELSISLDDLLLRISKTTFKQKG